MDTESMQSKTEVDWIHEIGSHIAAGDALDATLSATADFAMTMVNCDWCSIYVRDAADLAPRVWRRSECEAVNETRIPLSQRHTAFLTQHMAPIAISPKGNGVSLLLLFNQWSADPGETFVSVPLLAREKLMGVINLQHCRPRRYNLREVQLFSIMGFLVGSAITLSHLESKNSDLLLQLETRKLIERGKGILQRELGLSEEQAYLTLQRQSRQRRKSMKEIAQAVILGDDVKRSSVMDSALVWKSASVADTTRVKEC